MQILGQVNRLSKTKMEQEGALAAVEASKAAVSSSSHGDQVDRARAPKRSKLAVAKERKKSRRAKDTLPVLKPPASVKKRAVKRKRSGEEEGDDVDTTEAKTEMDAARALMGILNFGVIPSPVKLKASAVVPPGLSWLSTRKRSDRGRKAEGTGTSEDASSSQPGKSLSIAPTGNCEEGCQSDNERNDKRSTDCVTRLNSSDSSTDFALPDSRAQSPSSPLPSLASDACLSIITKLENAETGIPLLHRSAPLRPVKKVPVVRKPKVDGKNTVVIVVKHEEALGQVGKKKSRQPKRQVTAAAAKAELSSSGTLSVASLKDRSGHPADPAINCSEQQASGSLCVKDEALEGLTLGLLKATDRSGVKSRPVLSEIEKESRRLRRVQANRESARQTIRKKQLHCEELSQRAAELVSEQDGLKQEYNQKYTELQQLFEVQRKLKEELAICTGQKESSAANKDSVDLPAPQSSVPPFQFPMLPPPPGLMHPFLWSAFAAAMAQEAVKNMVHPHALCMPTPSSRPMHYPGNTASPDQVSPSHVLAIGQHPLVRQVSSVSNLPPPAGAGTDKAPPSSSGVGDLSKPVLPLPDVKESATRPVESCFSGRSSRIGGKASLMGLTSAFPRGPGGPDSVDGCLTGAIGSNLSYAFGPGHPVNRLAGVMRNPQVAGKFMGLGGPVHGGHFFFDNVQQQVIPMLAAPKPSGASAAAAAARKRRKELTRSRNIFNRHLSRTTSAEVVVPAAVS